MLTLLVGTPGSGKTLFAIDKIIKIANNDSIEFKNIEYVYNNISGFDFEKFKNNKVLFDRFVFDSFYVHLKILYSLFIQNENQDNLDDILQKYCKENKIFNAYFIIDEAHNNFDNQDKIKMWWFTYHRHLNHEILLITQNKSLINTQYRNVPEIFVKAQPRSKAISKNTLRYFNYTEYRMTQKFSTTEIIINDTYFDLYTSGNKSNQKAVGKKYIIMFIIFVLFLIFIFTLFIYKFYFNNPVPKKEEPKKEQIQIPSQTQTYKNQKIETVTNFENLRLFKFTCFDNFCYLEKDSISDKNSEIPFEILKKQIQNVKSDNLFFYQRNKKMIIYILDDAQKFNFIQGVRNDDSFQKVKDIDTNPNLFNQPKG